MLLAAASMGLGAAIRELALRPRTLRSLAGSSVARAAAAATAAPHDADAAFMDLALEEAAAARDAGEVPIGSVLVMAGEVVASARNRVEELQDASAHAEMLCMRAAAASHGGWRLNADAAGDPCPSTLYVTVEPCPMCYAALHGFRVERLVYGAPNDRLGAVHGAMRAPARSLLSLPTSLCLPASLPLSLSHSPAHTCWRFRSLSLTLSLPPSLPPSLPISLSPSLPPHPSRCE